MRRTRNRREYYWKAEMRAAGPSRSPATTFPVSRRFCGKVQDLRLWQPRLPFLSFLPPSPFFLSLSLLFLQCHCPTFFCSSHESHVCTFTFGNFFLFLISPFALFKTRLGDGVYLWNFFWNRGPKLWNLQLQIANPCKALAINCNRITDCVRPISFASTRRYLTFQDSKSFFF